MVLSSPPAHDPLRPETGWIEAIRRTLRLSNGGVLVHVDRGAPERLGELAKALFAEWPDIDVLDSVSGLESAPPGSTRVLVPRAGEAMWLNLNRPIVTRRDLKIVLFCDHATTIELTRKAPDFFDWVSTHVDCPKGPVPFALAGFRAALTARAAGIHWTGGVDQAAQQTVEELLAACAPGTVIRWVDVEGPYSNVVGELVRASPAEEPGAWLGSVADEQWKVWRFRWACAEAKRDLPQILLAPGLECPGFWPVHDRMMALGYARERLAGAGATRPGLLAVLLQMEPQAVSLAARLLQICRREDQMVSALVPAEDPGATLVRWAPSTTSALRPRPGSPLDVRAAGEPRRRIHAGIEIEGVLHRGARETEWSLLANVARAFGDRGLAAHWQARAPSDGPPATGELQDRMPTQDVVARGDRRLGREERLFFRRLVRTVFREAAQGDVETDRFAVALVSLAAAYDRFGAPEVVVPLLGPILVPSNPELEALFLAPRVSWFPFIELNALAKLTQILHTSFTARSARPAPATVLLAKRVLHHALLTQGRFEEAALVSSSVHETP